MDLGDTIFSLRLIQRPRSKMIFTYHKMFIKFGTIDPQL